MFRSFYGIALPLFIATSSIAFTMGLKYIFHSEFSTIDGLLYALIFTISVGDSVHIISAWYDPKYNIISDKREKMLKIMQHLLVPCFHTSFTTALGFGAIALCSIPQLRDFGIYASISVIFAYIITITLTPALLTLFNFKNTTGKNDQLSNVKEKKLNILDKIINHIIKGLSYSAGKHAKLILLIFIILTIISIVGLFRIKIGTNPYSFLKDNTDVNIALSFIEKNICGIEDLEIVLSGNENDFFLDPEVLKKVENIGNYISSLKGISQPNSYLSFLKLLHKALNENREDYYAIPENKELIRQYLFLYEMSGDINKIYSWLTSDYKKLRLNFKVSNSVNLNKINKEISNYFKEKKILFNFTITGEAYLWNKIDKVFLLNQVQSLLLSFISVFIFLFLISRSIRLGVFSVIVNFFPILVGFGFLGFSGIGLNMGTVLIAPIAVGIAVDDTIHFVSQYKILIKSNKNELSSIGEVFKIIVRPVLFTTVLLVMGFGSNIISNFKPNGYFGLVSAITLFVGMLTDFFLLPSLMLLFKSQAKK